MNEELLQKVSRRVKLLNILLISFGMMFVLAFAGVAVVGYIAIQEVRKVNDQINTVQNRIDNATGSTTELQDELCGSSGTLGTLLNNQSTICD